MCTYQTEHVDVDGSAKGPDGAWFHVTTATVYFDHPVHAMAGHTLNVDLADPARGPGGRVALELTAASARALATAIEAMLALVPEALMSSTHDHVGAVDARLASAARWSLSPTP